MTESLASLNTVCQVRLDPLRTPSGNTGAMHSIGKRIKAAREAKKLTQDQLGEVLGRTKAAVSQWENDIGYPDYFALAKLCDALAVSADWIIRGINTAYLSAAAHAFALRFDALSDSSKAGLAQVFGPPPSPAGPQPAPPADKINKP